MWVSGSIWYNRHWLDNSSCKDVVIAKQWSAVFLPSSFMLEIKRWLQHLQLIVVERCKVVFMPSTCWRYYTFQGIDENLKDCFFQTQYTPGAWWLMLCSYPAVLPCTVFWRIFYLASRWWWRKQSFFGNTPPKSFSGFLCLKRKFSGSEIYIRQR